MKKKIRFYIIVLLALVCFTTPHVSAATGYTYNHKSEVIYSAEGFTVNEMPYNYKKLGIEASDFSSPSDLFVFNGEDETLIYALDSKSNYMFVFDENLNLILKTNKFIYDADTLRYTNDDDVNGVQAEKEEEPEEPTPGETTPEEQAPGETQKDEDTIKKGELYLNSPLSIHRGINPNAEEKGELSDLIYICDNGNEQIVVIDPNSFDEEKGTFHVYQVISAPEEQLENKKFSPSEVLSDTAGRIYVICDNVGEGIMQFGKDGQFNAYVGVNYVTLSAWDIFWRNFASQAQREKMTTYHNTSFTDMVYTNFMIYATSYAITDPKSGGITNDNIMIKKINPSGKDVLRRNGYSAPKGDAKYIKTNDGQGTTNPSTFDGITVNDYGVYTVVDSKRGRLFTYDNEGNLLYISGEKGDVYTDNIQNPVAVQYLGETILVLDKYYKTIIKFEPTEIAKIINKAVKEEYNGRSIREIPTYNKNTKTWWIGSYNTKITDPNKDVTEANGHWIIGNEDTGIETEELAAADYWEQVIALNANYEYAYVGIGKKYNELGDYKEAMKYFKLGADRVYYGKAFKQYRDALIKKYFSAVVITIVVVIVGVEVLIHIRRKKLGIVKEEETGIGDE